MLPPAPQRWTYGNICIYMIKYFYICLSSISTYVSANDIIPRLLNHSQSAPEIFSYSPLPLCHGEPDPSLAQSLAILSNSTTCSQWINQGSCVRDRRRWEEVKFLIWYFFFIFVYLDHETTKLMTDGWIVISWLVTRWYPLLLFSWSVLVFITENSSFRYSSQPAICIFRFCVCENVLLCYLVCFHVLR